MRFCAFLLLMSLFCFPAVAEVTVEEPAEALVEMDGSEEEVLLFDDDQLADPVPAFEALSYGDAGDEVLEMQTKLTELGYYHGNLSGEFHESTRAALRAFQLDYGLEATGKGDQATLEILYESAYRKLQYGDKGNDVKALQERLMSLGYYTGKISGNFLNGTQSAIASFQTRNSLESTGVADVETQRLLYSAKALGRTDKTKVTPTPAPANDSYLVDDSAVQEVVETPQNAVAFEKTLKYGRKGEQVKALQTRLTNLGYYSGPISGNFLAKTQSAVKALQKQNALEPDGVVDETLWNRIFYDTALVLPVHTAKPTPEPTPIPFAITVDVNNQVTTVYGRDEYGNYSVVVRQMLCSTGKKATPSDPGDWVLNGRKARWCEFPRWGGKAQYWTRINSSIAFHSVIYNSTNTMDMSVSSYKALGRRASHGCIRLTVADAKWIYDNCGKGTVVSIREDMPTDQELVASLQLPALDYSRMLPKATPQPTPVPDYQAGTAPEFQFRKLQRGDSGEDVYWLQRKLTDLGYYSGKCSGTFLNGTQSAVKAFQRDHHISANGVATVATQEALYAEGMISASPAPAEIELPPELAGGF